MYLYIRALQQNNDQLSIWFYTVQKLNAEFLNWNPPIDLTNLQCILDTSHIVRFIVFVPELFTCMYPDTCLNYVNIRTRS